MSYLRSVTHCPLALQRVRKETILKKNITPISAELEWIHTTTVPVTDAQAEDVSKLIERLEQDEDVNKVFHNMG